jgi:uncharacterized membrane protein YqjE
MVAPSRPAAPNGAPPPAEDDIDLPPGREPSFGELISRTTHDLSQLLRDEVELAKVEIRDEAKAAGRAGALMGVAGMLGFLTLALVCAAAAWALAELMPTGLAFLVVAIVVGAFAAVAFVTGRKRIETLTPVPTQTVETLEEDVQWARQLRS